MPFILIVIGLLLFVSAIQGTTKQLGTLLVEDFTGQHSFLYWVVAILVIGGVGYIKPLKVLSDMFLLLLVIVLFLGQKGFFSQFQSALNSIANSSPTSKNAAPQAWV